MCAWLYAAISTTFANVDKSLLSCFTGVGCDKKPMTTSLQEVMNLKFPFFPWHLAYRVLLCRVLVSYL